MERESLRSKAFKFSEWARGDKGRRIILAAGLIGLALIAVSAFWPDSGSSSSTAAAVKTADDFVAETEQKLTGIIENIEGAGDCRVMVTLANGIEYIYASQQKTNSDLQQDNDRISQRDDNEENIIIVDSENGRQGLIVTEIQPTVKGVVIVCQGGDRADVQQRITDAVTTALNISSKRVCVIKLS